MSYKFLNHTADVKFRVESPTIEEMFSSAADALNETIRGDIKILEQEEEKFEVEGKDLEGLLYNFLEEFLFLLDAEDFLAAKIKSIKIDLENKKLNCIILGDKAENYKFTNDVKAVTYNGMFVKEKEGKFICEIVLDV
ncbi:archease [Candidatus Pacearchaeota archaeon]|nr:archease [Candidatus Pacearchaeota archaeon]